MDEKVYQAIPGNPQEQEYEAEKPLNEAEKQGDQQL